MASVRASVRCSANDIGGSTNLIILNRGPTL